MRTALTVLRSDHTLRTLCLSLLFRILTDVINRLVVEEVKRWLQTVTRVGGCGIVIGISFGIEEGMVIMVSTYTGGWDISIIIGIGISISTSVCLCICICVGIRNEGVVLFFSHSLL